MKKILFTLFSFLLLPTLAMAQMNVPQGGTGTTTFPTNWFLVGNTSLRLTATNTPYFPAFFFGSATGTSLFTTTASTTNLFGTNINGFGLTTCNGASSALTWSAGVLGCHVISAGSAASTTLLSDNNNFSGNNIFANATSTNWFSTTASSTNLFTAMFSGAGLVNCNGATNALIYTLSTKLFGCNTISAGSSASSTLLGDNNTFSGNDVFSNTITGSVSGNAGTATKLATGRTLAITGDLTWTSPSFDGSANVTAAGTLATVNGNVGSFGGVNSIPSFTVNAKGLVTAASANTPAIPASEITSGTFGTGNYTFPADLTITGNATSSAFFATTASTTNFFGAGLFPCASPSFLGWTAGKFTCGIPVDTTSSSTLYADNGHFTGGNIFTASTTIGNGTASTGLTVNGTATTTNLIVTGSSTLANFTFNNATGTNATTTTLFSSTASSTNLYFTNGNGANFTLTSAIGSGTRCAQFSSTGILSAALAACGSGSGSGAGTWSTTTSNVSGQLNNYSNNTTDIVNIGGSATTSSVFYFDPNLPLVSLGTGTTNIQFVGNANSYFTNNVGFGTTTPRWAVQISSSTKPQLALSDASLTSDIWTIRNAGGNLYFATASPATFATTSVSALSLIKAGQSVAVGIGTDNPTGVNANSRLTVAGTGATDITASSTDDTTSTATIFNAFAPGARSFLGAHGQSQVSTQYGIPVGGYGELATIDSTFGTSNGLLIGTRTKANPIIFGNNSLERMRITGTGNVGIGTSTPFGKLSVTATSGQTNPVFAVASSTNALEYAFFDNTGSSDVRSQMGPTDNNAWSYGYVSADGSFAFGSTTSLSNNLSLILGRNGTSTIVGGLTISGNSTTTNATTTNLAVSGIASTSRLYLGNIGGSGATCLQAAANGLVTGIGSACGAGGGDPYPFKGTGNSTSTLTQFNAGLTAYATTTIGAGGVTTGLTVSGGATTTGTTTLASLGGHVIIGQLPAYGYLPNDLLDITGIGGGMNDYQAVNIVNPNAGICATSDLTAANDLASNAMFFADLGHTSSAFTGSGCTNNPFTGFGRNSTYIFDPNGWMNFAIGSTAATSSFNWFTGGYALANQKMTLMNAGNLGIGTTTPNTGYGFGLVVASTTPTIDLMDSDGALNAKHVFLQNNGGVLSAGTSTDSVTASSTWFTAQSSIDNATHVGFGTTSAYATVSVLGTGVWQGLTSSTAGTPLCILSNFSIVSPGGTTCALSSQYIKHDIADITKEQAENAITKLHPISYTNNDDGTNHYGFIAEEVAQVDPRIAVYETVESTIDGHTFKVGDPLSVDYDKTTALIVKYLQDHKETFEGAKRSAEENWQWIAIAVLTLGMIRQQYQIRKLTQ